MPGMGLTTQGRADGPAPRWVSGLAVQGPCGLDTAERQEIQGEQEKGGMRVRTCVNTRTDGKQPFVSSSSRKHQGLRGQRHHSKGARAETIHSGPAPVHNGGAYHASVRTAVNRNSLRVVFGQKTRMRPTPPASVCRRMDALSHVGQNGPLGLACQQVGTAAVTRRRPTEGQRSPRAWRPRSAHARPGIREQTQPNASLALLLSL